MDVIPENGVNPTGGMDRINVGLCMQTHSEPELGSLACYHLFP
jgi:hypothetical protein